VGIANALIEAFCLGFAFDFNYGENNFYF